MTAHQHLCPDAENIKQFNTLAFSHRWGEGVQLPLFPASCNSIFSSAVASAADSFFFSCQKPQLSQGYIAFPDLGITTQLSHPAKERVGIFFRMFLEDTLTMSSIQPSILALKFRANSDCFEKTEMGEFCLPS